MFPRSGGKPPKDGDRRSLSRLGHHMANIVFFPTTLYLILRHSNAAAVSAILGNSGSNFGVDNDLTRFGGLLADGETHVLAGYADIQQSNRPVPDVAAIDGTGVELLEYLNEQIPFDSGDFHDSPRSP